MFHYVALPALIFRYCCVIFHHVPLCCVIFRYLRPARSFGYMFGLGDPPGHRKTCQDMKKRRGSNPAVAKRFAATYLQHRLHLALNCLHLANRFAATYCCFCIWTADLLLFTAVSAPVQQICCCLFDFLHVANTFVDICCIFCTWPPQAPACTPWAPARKPHSPSPRSLAQGLKPPSARSQAPGTQVPDPSFGVGGSGRALKLRVHTNENKV